MLRRFEIYPLRSAAPAAAVDRLVTACRRAGDHIPEVLHSHVGWNRSEAPAALVWEHAFASPAAYARYMAHPYHAAVLDRYLLPDSPERVVADDALGAGLVGYEADDLPATGPVAVRRLVLLRLAADAEPRRRAAFVSAVAAAAEQDRRLLVSVLAANTLGPAWFDAVTPVGPPPRFTHLWEQGFATLDDLAACAAGSSPLAVAERAGWAGVGDGVVRLAVALHYEVDGTPPWPHRVHE